MNLRKKSEALISLVRQANHRHHYLEENKDSGEKDVEKEKESEDGTAKDAKKEDQGEDGEEKKDDQAEGGDEKQASTPPEYGANPYARDDFAGSVTDGASDVAAADT